MLAVSQMPEQKPAASQGFEEEEDEEVYIEGEVVDDLEGQEDPNLDGDDDSEADDHGAGPSGDHAMLEDDSFHTFDGHEDAVVAVAWNPVQRDLVATGGCDDKAYMWRVGQDAYESTSGSMGTYELSGHTDTVVSVGFNAAGTLLATAGMDGVCKIWSTSNGQLLRTLEGTGGALEWVRWHPKGDVVIAGTDDFMVYMWNAATGAVMQVFSGHSGTVTSGAFTPDGKALVTVGGEDDASLRVWNPKTGECGTTLQGHPFHAEGILCLGLNSEGAVAITGGLDGAVCLSNVHNGRVLGALQGHEDSVEAVGFASSLPLAASAGVDGKLLIWDCATLSQRGACEHPAGVTRAAWHPTQPLVFTACMDGVARCWDMRTNACVRAYGGHEDAVQDIAVSADGAMLLTGSDDKTAKAYMVQQS